MSAANFATIAAWSYGIAAAAYLALALRMVIGWRRGTRAHLLMLAAFATTIWAAAALADVLLDSTETRLLSRAADFLRYGAWIGFVASLLAFGSNAERAVQGLSRPGFWLVAVVLLAGFVFPGGLHP